MTDVALAPAVATVAAPLPYPSGPVSRFLGWMESPAWRPWAVVVVVAGFLVGWAHAVLWLTGLRAVGSVDSGAIILAFYLPYTLSTAMIGRRISRRALSAFWPATGWPAGEKASWLYGFLNVPFRQELAALLVGLAVGFAALLAARGAIGGPGDDPTTLELAFLPIFAGGYGITGVALVTTFRWLRLVTRIHRDALAIDPFDKGPIYAFSRLTVFIGLSVLAGVYYTATVNAPFVAGNLPAILFIPATAVLGAAAFVVPLWGIHGRLVGKKDELLVAVDRRMQAAGAELYERVDGGSYEQGKAINDTLAGLRTLRERIRDLPTWPWPPQVLRGFVSALLLPVIVYILSRLAAGVISL